MRQLLIYCMGLNCFIYGQQVVSNSSSKICFDIGSTEIPSYGFVVHDTSNNFYLKSNIKTLLNEYTNAKSDKIKKKLQQFEQVTKIESSNDEKIFNGVKSFSFLKDSIIPKANEINNIHSKIFEFLDSSGIAYSINSEYADEFLTLSNSIHSLILKHNNGIDYLRGLSYSDRIWYNKYAVQILDYFLFKNGYFVEHRKVLYILKQKKDNVMIVDSFQF
ncbi:MAG: hypothetical protein KF704_00240 [Crocinitomicaceae bacterium]|nr:hypothetical protein [Crocinitomicaceae bacterium]NGF75189.1 hypothetical protein [Fluviicola sp. SGL-29]